MSEFNTLILSGGSIRFVSMLGALQYCEDNRLIDNITTYVGTSAGAIIAYLLIIGYTPIELIALVCSHKLFKEELPIFNVVSMMSGSGAVSFGPLQELLEKLTIERIGSLVTLGYLRDHFHKDLVVSTFNYYPDRKLEYLGPDTHPDMPCIVALRMSVSIPLVFEMYKYAGNLYLDAAVVENFPIGYIMGQPNIDSVRALGVVIQPHFYETDSTHDVYALYKFIHNVLSIPMKTIQDYQLERVKELDLTTVDIETDVHFMNYYLNSREKLDLFSNGYKSASSVFDVDPE